MLNTKSKLKFWAVFAAAAILIWLGSANDDRISDLGAVAYVQAIGVDKADDGGIDVTLQVFQGMGSGSETQLDATSPNSKSYSSTAKSYELAKRNIESITGRTIFTGQTKVIVLSSSLSSNEIFSLLEDFAVDKDIPLSGQLAFTEQKAKEVLSVELSQGITSAENFSEIISQSQRNGLTVYSALHRILQERVSGSVVMPIVEAYVSDQDNKQESDNGSGGGSQGESESQSGGEENVPDSVRVCEGDSAVCIAKGKDKPIYLSQNASAGINILKGGNYEGMITIEDDGEPAVVSISQIKSDCKYKNGEMTFDLVFEINNVGDLKTDSTQLVRKKICDSIFDMTDEVFSKITEHGVDSAELMMIIRRDDYEDFQEYQNGNSNFSDMSFKVNIKPKFV